MENMKDRVYVERKIAHMKRQGTNAGISETGAAQPDHIKSEAEARQKRQERISKRNKSGNDIEWV